MSLIRHGEDRQCKPSVRAAHHVFRLVTGGTGCLALGILLGAATGPDAPRVTVDDDCPAFAFAPDNNRILYAVRHVYSQHRIELQRDDIWEVTLDGKKRRLVNGEKLVQGNAPFSYAIQVIRMSPDGGRMTVEMLTSAMIDAQGNTREGELSDLMDANGKEIKIRGADSAIDGALEAAWLADGVTVVYLREAVKPKLLYTIESVRPAGGRGAPLFEGHTFTAIAWDARRNSAIAIERDRSLAGPIQLVALDLLHQTRRELATLDGFLGHLTISPSGSKVAYFHDGDTLEIRDLVAPDRAVRVPMAFGRYEWAPDERRLLLKRGPDHQSAELFWVNLPDGRLEPLLHSLIFRDFQISPDGHWLAVTAPGKRRLFVYPLQ